MKKIAIFFITVVAIVSLMFFTYSNYKANIRQAQKENLKFDIYVEKEIQGLELATLINKAIDSNEKNEVKKDNKEKYIDNEKKKINIDIKFIDDDELYNIEKIYNSGIEKFLTYYRFLMFKNTEVKYHSSGKIKYMKFEQISE